MKIALKIVNQFWFMKLHAWMWLKLTQKTFISKEIKYWWWSVTYFSFVSLKMWQFLIFKKIFRRFFFLFTNCHMQIAMFNHEHFSEITKFSRKNPKTPELAGASQQYRRQRVPIEIINLWGLRLKICHFS